MPCVHSHSRVIDSFVVVSVLNNRHHTPVAKRNVSPTYNAKEATFDFPIYLSLAEKLGVVELVIWDKDTFKKDYLGEVAIPLDDWFRDDNAYPFDDPNNKVRPLARWCCAADAQRRCSRTPSTCSLQDILRPLPVPSRSSLVLYNQRMSLRLASSPTSTTSL